MKMLATALLFVVFGAICIPALTDVAADDDADVDATLDNDKSIIEDNGDDDDDDTEARTTEALNVDRTTAAAPEDSTAEDGQRKSPSWQQRRKNRKQHRRLNGIRQFSEEEKMNFLCRHLASNASESRRLKRRPRDATPASAATNEKKDKIIQLWKERKHEMLTCCHLEKSERVPCSRRVRNARFNRICNSEDPLFEFKRSRSGRAKEEGGESDGKGGRAALPKCCESQAEQRYECFEAEKQKWRTEKGRKRRGNVNLRL